MVSRSAYLFVPAERVLEGTMKWAPYVLMSMVNIVNPAVDGHLCYIHGPIVPNLG